jgi:hypothetical protein
MVTRVHFRKKKPSFDQTAAEILRFKRHVTAIGCPSCLQNTLQVDKLEVGPDAWTSDISCTNCPFKGSANTSGFSFVGVSKVRATPKAKEKEAEKKGKP